MKTNNVTQQVKPFVGFYDADPELPWYVPIIDSEVIKTVSTQLTLLGDL